LSHGASKLLTLPLSQGEGIRQAVQREDGLERRRVSLVEVRRVECWESPLEGALKMETAHLSWAAIFGFQVGFLCGLAAGILLMR